MGAGVALILKGAPDEKVDLISSGRRRARDAGARGRSQVQGTAGTAAAAGSRGSVAFGAGIQSDYIFRGVSQSNHKPSVNAYFEPRYNVSPYLQLYAGTAASTLVPEPCRGRVDGFAGIRPTFGPLALDFGGVYYWYPGGSCFNGSTNPVFGVDCLRMAPPINGNVIKKDLSFWEAYAKGTYTVNDQVWLLWRRLYSPSVLNSGRMAPSYSGGAKFTAPSPRCLMAGDFTSPGKPVTGSWAPATLLRRVGVPNGIPYKSYTTWNVGIGITKSVFTLDFRYYDTDLNQGDCNAFTSDQNARFTNAVTAINPGGFGSSWCGSSFVVAGKFDLTAMANLK